MTESWSRIDYFRSLWFALAWQNAIAAGKSEDEARVFADAAAECHREWCQEMGFEQ